MTIYLLHQRLRYEYPAAIRHLAHRLVVIPPERHGDQRRVLHRLDVSGAAAQVTPRLDGFGNHVIEVRAPRGGLGHRVRGVGGGGATGGGLRRLVPVERLGDSRLLAPSALTTPDAALCDAAAALRAAGRGDLRATGAADQRMGVPGDDLPGRCHRGADDGGRRPGSRPRRLPGLRPRDAGAVPAVSGYPPVTCRGISSAKAAPTPGSRCSSPPPVSPGQAMVVALDPTHDREVGTNYLTIAVGRDYLDVAPTSGTFVARCRGRLSTRKHLSVSDAGFALAS